MDGTKAIRPGPWSRLALHHTGDESMRDMYGERYSAREVLVAIGMTLAQFLFMMGVIGAFTVILWAIAFGVVWSFGVLFWSPPAATWQNFVMYGTIAGAPMLFLGALIWIGLRDRFRENIREVRRIRRAAGGRHD
jgi:predicted RND superfamily exporter protein